MADFYSAIIQTTTPTSDGDVSYKTPDLGGKTPKGMIIFITDAQTLGTINLDWRAGIGFTDGTLQNNSYVSSVDGGASVNCGRRFSTTTLIQRGGDENAVFSQWLSDTGDGETGVELTWADTNAFEKIVTMIFFSGDDLSCHVDTTVGPNSGSTDVNDVGFQPDIIFHHCSGSSTGVSDFFTPSWGISYDNGSSIDNWCIAKDEVDAATESEMRSWFESGNVARQAGLWQVGTDSFDASGFSYTNISGSPSGDLIAHLALKIDGGDTWAGIVDTPTSTGNDIQTGPGFEPMIVGIYETMHTTISSTVVTDAKAGALGFSHFTPDEEWCWSLYNEVGAATINCGSLYENKAVTLLDDDAADAFNADFVSLNSTGWTLDFTTANGTTRKWLGFALGDGTGGGTAHTKDLNDSITLTDSEINSIGLAKSDSIAISDAFLKEFGLNKSDTVSLVDSLENKEIGLNKSDSTSLTDSLASKDMGLSKSDTINLSDAVAKVINIAQSDTISLSDNFNSLLILLLALSDTINMADSIAKEAGLAKSDALTISDAIITKEIGLNKADSISISDSLDSKNIGLNKSDTINLTDLISKVVNISQADTIDLTDNFSAIIAIILALSDTINLTDSLDSKEIGLGKSDTINLTDSISSKDIGLEKSDTISLTDAIAKAVGIFESDTINLSDNFDAIITLLLVLADTINLSDSITTKEIGLGKADIINMSDNISTAVEFFKTIADELNMSDDILKTAAITLIDEISLSDAISFPISGSPLYNYIADNVKFNYDAETKTYNIIAGNKTFNFNAKPGP